MISKPVAALTAVAVAALLVAGGVVISEQRGRIWELEQRLDKADKEIETARVQTEDAEEVSADLQVELDRMRAYRDTVLGRALDLDTCISRFSSYRTVGEQTVSFGFVTGVSGDGQFGFDPAEIFEHGYIRNDARTKVAKRLHEDAVVLLTTAVKTSIPDPRCVGAGRFGRIFRNPQPWQQSVRTSPYWLVERDGAVVRLVEQYRP